jgi:uncharacterized protein YndB with AHSA1/START domain
MSDTVEAIIARVTIDAPRAHVWDVMTGEATVPEWLGCMNYRRAPGHVFHMQQDAAKRAAGDISGATHCAVLELSPPDLFVFSWYFPGTPETRVTMALTDTDTGGTMVTLSHEGWEQFPPAMIRSIRDALAGGWAGHVLPGLKRVAESARPGSVARD